MPRLRRCGGTNTPPATSTTGRSPIRMRPAFAFSSPATQRSVVVLPQPEGPSSVTISPAATSKSMPATAATVSVLPAKVFVSPSTRIIAHLDLLADAEAAADHPGDRTEHHQQEEHDHPKGAEKKEGTFLPQIEDNNGRRAILRAREHQRDGELAIGMHHNPEPGGEQPRLKERQHDLDEIARPGDARDLRGLVELAVDRHHR